MNDNRQIDETGRPEQDDARAWVVLLASGKVTADQAAAFRKWHASHPAHAHAFAEVKQHWNIIGQATHELARDVVPADGPRRNIAPSVSRRWVLGTGAVAAGIAVLALRPPLDLWSPLVDFSADYRTGIGELQTIAMGQNVTVELSTRSRLALRSDRPDGLRVALLAGEAAVASDSRSVSVIAGDGETRVTSGRFNLRNDDGVVRVTCLAGTIDVTCGDRQVALHASQQTSYSGQGLVAPTRRRCRGNQRLAARHPRVPQSTASARHRRSQPVPVWQDRSPERGSWEPSPWRWRVSISIGSMMSSPRWKQSTARRPAVCPVGSFY